MTSIKNEQYDAVALFSGGLDSILAARLVQDQGLRVLCLHFVTPFFGKASKVAHWENVYDVQIKSVDISKQFVQLLLNRPVHGFGKILNPCMDCKILMLQHAHAFMKEVGAQCIITGEVLGQRPMSQRRDALDIIRKDAAVQDVLLRPLCAKLQPVSAAEASGLIDRSKLLAISGRGRKEQLALAKAYNFSELPTPAGGCRLAERENAKRYWGVLQYAPTPVPADFRLSDTGRQYWSMQSSIPEWMAIGRNKGDNEHLLRHVGSNDFIFKLENFPGPIALGRQYQTRPWSTELIHDAASFVASFSPKAVAHAAETGEALQLRIIHGEKNIDDATLLSAGECLEVIPSKKTVHDWREMDWETDTRPEIKAERKTES